MSKFVLRDQKIFVDDYNLTGDTNAVAINYGVDAKEATVLGNDTHINKGGLKTVQLQASGFMSPSDQDNELYANVGVIDVPVSVAAEGATEGNVCYFFKTAAGEYQFGESVGEINKYSMGAGAAGDLIRGIVGHDASETAETITGNSTGQQLGAVSSSQKLYAALHVIDSDGSGDQTLDVEIVSDDNSGFTSEVSRLSFAQIGTSTDSELLQLDGPLTDDYFRVNFTIGGTGSPSFKFFVTIGVQ